MLISPLVLGVSSSSLSQSEVSVLNEINPYGLILFTRNIDNKLQLKKLINEIKEKVREDIHILIDQEGGKVQRLDIPLETLPLISRDWRSLHKICKSCK